MGEVLRKEGLENDVPGADSDVGLDSHDAVLVDEGMGLAD